MQDASCLFIHKDNPERAQGFFTTSKFVFNFAAPLGTLFFLSDWCKLKLNSRHAFTFYRKNRFYSSLKWIILQHFKCKKNYIFEGGGEFVIHCKTHCQITKTEKILFQKGLKIFQQKNLSQILEFFFRPMIFVVSLRRVLFPTWRTGELTSASVRWGPGGMVTRWLDVPSLPLMVSDTQHSHNFRL